MRNKYRRMLNDIESLEKQVMNLRNEIQGHERLIGKETESGWFSPRSHMGGIFCEKSIVEKLIFFVPEAFTVTQLKSSERPPNELFKAVNNISGHMAYASTEEEAKRGAAYL